MNFQQTFELMQTAGLKEWADVLPPVAARGFSRAGNSITSYLENSA